MFCTFSYWCWQALDVSKSHFINPYSLGCCIFRGFNFLLDSSKTLLHSSPNLNSSTASMALGVPRSGSAPPFNNVSITTFSFLNTAPASGDCPRSLREFGLPLWVRRRDTREAWPWYDASMIFDIEWHGQNSDESEELSTGNGRRHTRLSPLSLVRLALKPAGRACSKIFNWPLRAASNICEAKATASGGIESLLDSAIWIWMMVLIYRWIFLNRLRNKLSRLLPSGRTMNCWNRNRTVQ